MMGNAGLVVVGEVATLGELEVVGRVEAVVVAVEPFDPHAVRVDATKTAARSGHLRPVVVTSLSATVGPRSVLHSWDHDPIFPSPTDPPKFTPHEDEPSPPLRFRRELLLRCFQGRTELPVFVLSYLAEC